MHLWRRHIRVRLRWPCAVSVIQPHTYTHLSEHATINPVPWWCSYHHCDYWMLGG